jgi:hypothetical protein
MYRVLCCCKPKDCILLRFASSVKLKDDSPCKDLRPLDVPTLRMNQNIDYELQGNEKKQEVGTAATRKKK